MLILNENSGRYYEYASHKLHLCPNRPQYHRQRSSPPLELGQEGNKKQHKTTTNNKYVKGDEYYDNYPRKKARVILCPMNDCRHACVDEVERDDNDITIVNQLKDHMHKYHAIKVTDAFVEMVTNKIRYFRTNRVTYHDPFCHVSFEELFMKEYVPYEIAANPHYGKVKGEGKTDIPEES
jgi:hypothetical protein